jgi:dephospho-CoA kinase
MSKLIVGLTGGIGSGKTAVSTLFEKAGINVVDADLCSRKVVEKGTPALQAIQNHFGPDILNSDATLNRAALRAKIFANAKERIWLEQLLHPLIHQELQAQLKKSSSIYTILVSPLLIESGQNTLCQKLIVVDVPQSLQIERTIQRDNNSRELVESIMATQAPREKRLAMADEVIENVGSLADLEIQVLALHHKFLGQLLH